MRVWRVDADAPPSKRPPVVAAIGNFDGLHRGHRALVGTVVQRAAELGVQSAIITFDPHPRVVLQPHVPLTLLSTLEDKAELLEQLGIDHLVVFHFDRALQMTSAPEFIERVSQWVDLRHLVHGPGVGVGRNREGTAEVLAKIGRERGFSVEEIRPLRVPAGHLTLMGDGVPHAARESHAPVTSTAIRELVAEGRIRRATEALTRRPTVTGVVEEGEKVGRTLGFPTANLRVADQQAVPSDGVYAAWAEVRPYTKSSMRHPAAVSIGMRPQFDGRRRVVEAHLLDFQGDLYGQTVRLHFEARLRGQQKFTSVDELVRQIEADVAATRTLLTAPAAGESDLIAADG